MYRFCRLFASEITAGENLLRNGYLPILRENGLTDHGVLFAANGTCKTTLLSFILNVFCPDQRRFVQHLQSGGDKTLEQYLIPGRPAVVLLDMAVQLPPSLFEEEPLEHLVLGQLLYRHRSAPDKMDRTYFLAQSPEFFDTLRGTWDTLLGKEQPYKAIRDFMTPHIQQTTSQKEWLENIGRLGLDPWLIDRQIDFARTEGGIKDAFKFPSESDFLSFFLGCVADLDAAVTLRESIGQSLQKMADRPRKVSQLKSARDLKGQIANFDAIARDWREARDAAEAWRAKLGEASHLLRAARQTADRKLDTLKPGLAEAEAARRDARQRLHIAQVNILALERLQMARQIGAMQSGIAEAETIIAQLQGETGALTAADHLARIRKRRAAAEIKEAALLQADAEMAPALQKVKGLAARYHLRLDADHGRIQEAIADLKTRIAEAKSTERTVEAHRKKQAEARDAMDRKAARARDVIQAAEARRAALPMELGEGPSEARKRLAEIIDSIREGIGDAEKRKAALEEELKEVNRRWRELQEQRSGLETRLGLARQRQSAEAKDRSRLTADSQLRRLSGTPDVEPASAELLSRLDDAIAREEDRLDARRRELLGLENELDRLGRAELLAADDATQRLIGHYHQAGLSPGELKSFPEYLADLYESPETVAAFIEGNPARFTGIMAASAQVIEAVAALPVPDWLHRPVVISTPCPPDALSPIEEVVIRPPDTRIYAKGHLEEVRARIRERYDALGQKIADKDTALREMLETSRALHAYRETYPDRAAVTALAGRVEDLEAGVAALSSDIESAEARGTRVAARKEEEVLRHLDLSSDLARHGEWLAQVDKWLDAYPDLDAWYQELDTIGADLAALDKGMAADAQRLRDTRDAVGRLAGDIRVQETRLHDLDTRAADLPRPQDYSLSLEDREAALSMDLQTLRSLYEAAREDERQMASRIGIDLLRKELDDLREAIAEGEARFEAFRRDHPFDEALADIWAVRSEAEREDHGNSLAAALEERKERRIRLDADLRHRKKEMEALQGTLAGWAEKQIMPDMHETSLDAEDLDAVLHRLRGEEARQAQTCGLLEERCKQRREALDAFEAWRREIELAEAETRIFPAVWDGDSPRIDWPDLGKTAEGEKGIAAVRMLRDRVQEMISAEQTDRGAVESTRRRMAGAFERLQGDLQSEAYRKHLPAVIDVLRGHDAESLGAQARELIQRCEEIARNIESDLEISQRIVDNLLEMLLQRGREYHQKLQAAAQETIPEDVFIYGGKPILRAGTRLDFTKHRDVFRKSVENWLYELIQQGRLPEVNPRVGNCLGAELLYQLLGAASGKKQFGIRLLKCDDTGRNFEAVGKDLGSGGEALTTAVLLYTLLISMRKKRRHQSDDRIPAFLVLDNPLGVCNRSDFLDAQLKVARAMGIQCVYLTGINDRESLDLFELRVAIRKADRKIEIAGTTYDCLEVTELNVERHHGPPAA